MKDYNNFMLYENSKVFYKIHKLNYLFIKILIILILILYFILSYYFSNKIILYNINNSDYDVKIKDKQNINLLYTYPKGIYYYEKKPFISILIPHFDIIKPDKIHSKIIMLKNLLNQSIKNIEILLSFKKNNTIYDKIMKFSKLHQEIKIFNSEYNIYNNTIELILESKGKFITVINKYLNIREPQLYEKVFNQTLGKINNIYEYKVENEVHYLIKNKILKDIIDNETIFFQFNNLEKYIKSLPQENLNYISIAFCLDNKYAIYGYVSMISILESKNFNTFVSFYIIVHKNFTEFNKNIILSLYEQYDLLNITIIYMDGRYNNVKINNYLNEIAYYRLSLGELLPNINKIIYLDSDVLVYKDLTNLFNTNFNGHMILSRKMPKDLKIKKIFKINTGVLLLNLKKMRNIKLEENVIKIINNGFTSSVQDQGLLIKYYLKYIGELKEKYNVPNHGFTSLINYYKNKKLFYKNNYLRFIINHPAIKHFIGPMKSKKYINSYDWWYFASKSKYYSFIRKNKN